MQLRLFRLLWRLQLLALGQTIMVLFFTLYSNYLSAIVHSWLAIRYSHNTFLRTTCSSTILSVYDLILADRLSDYRLQATQIDIS